MCENRSDNRPRRRGLTSLPDPDPISPASVPASGAPRYADGVMFRKVCVIKFARIIAAMWIFENPRSESGGEGASWIGAKYQQVEHRVTD